MSDDRINLLQRVLFSWTTGCLLLSSCQTPPLSHREPGGGGGPTSFAVYYGKNPESQALSRVDWAIVQDSYPVPAEGKTRYLAYLSLGEIDPGTAVADEVAGDPGGLDAVTLSKNTFWNSRVADIRIASYRKALLDRIAWDLRHGFGGIFFDTLDSPLEYRREHPRKGAGMRRAIVSFLQTVHVSYPLVPLVVNRGFEILPEIATDVSGVLYEDFCSRYDETGKTYMSVPPEDRAGFLKAIGQAEARNASLVVMALDYDDPTHPGISAPCQKESRQFGFLHYVSDWSLMTLDPALLKGRE